MIKSRVAVIKTTAASVVDDIGRLLELAQVERHLDSNIPTILKINISWHFYYPACSTTPWQLDGVIKALARLKFKELIPAQNRTVVVDPRQGALNNHLDTVIAKHHLKFVYLYEPEVEWINYRPKDKMLVLDDIFKDGIQIPKLFVGKNAFHLPTMKTHVFTTITGAMKNAFGGLLNDNRHWTHGLIHETLVDLLRVQKEIHPGIFCLTDGTIAGNGAGPRAMSPVVKNYLIAGADSVAIDAICAKMMGFDPLAIKFLNLANEYKLGNADPRNIDVIGEDISKVNFHFKVKDTFASRGQKAIYWGFLKPLENLLLRSPIVPWSFLASRAYHDFFWYPVFGRSRVRRIMRTEWGRAFEKYRQY